LYRDDRRISGLGGEAPLAEILRYAQYDILIVILIIQTSILHLLNAIINFRSLCNNSPSPLTGEVRVRVKAFCLHNSPLTLALSHGGERKITLFHTG
jgi:hypothetical protein